MESIKKDDKSKKIVSEDGFTHHTYSKQEVYTFSEHINFFLKDEPILKDYLPINSDTEEIFEKVGDGLILCKMVNAACPGTIEQRAINTKKPLNVFKIKENLNLAISSSKTIGCKIENIHAEFITDKKPNIILGLTWQIVKIHLLQNITLKNHPYLIRLKRDDEELEDLLKLPREELLLRWFNYHLKAAGASKLISNFGSDLKDGQSYLILLHQLDSTKCNKAQGLKLQGIERHKLIIQYSSLLGVPQCIKPSQIANGVTKLNLLFLAHIFNNCPGLTPNEEENQLIETAGIIDDDQDIEAGLEARTYRMWINSMNIQDVYVNTIPNDLNDGIALLQIIEKMFPGKVDWNQCKMALKNTKSRLNQVQLCNYVVDLCKELKIHLTGIGGVDIVDSKRTLVFAILFQLMQTNIQLMIGDLTEEKLVEWFNSNVGKENQIANFKDPQLQDGISFLQLLQNQQNGLINWDLVQKGDSDEELSNNSKYVISAARKMGATVFLVSEHIKKVNHQFLFTFTASVYNTCVQQQK